MLRPTSASFHVHFVIAFLTTCLFAGFACSARADINKPGFHGYYTVELEPALIWQWNGDEAAIDDGIGLGIRASIPVLQQGPFGGLDNNLAITFGLAFAHFPQCRSNGGSSCTENDYWVPIAAQWNLFLTPELSVFPEFGLGFRNATFSGGAVCTSEGCQHSSLEVHPVLWFGGRYKLLDQLAIVARLGTPWLQLGVSVWF